MTKTKHTRKHTKKHTTRKNYNYSLETTFHGLHKWQEAKFEKLGWMILAKSKGHMDKVMAYARNPTLDVTQLFKKQSTTVPSPAKASAPAPVKAPIKVVGRPVPAPQTGGNFNIVKELKKLQKL